MANQGEQPDERARLRVSDAERHQVVELLQLAAGEGRLDVEELEERLEAAWAARTYADLAPLTADLPGAGGPVVPARTPGAPPVGLRPGGGVPAVQHDSSIAVMSAQQRRGAWQVGPTHQALAVMGSVELDLREAHFLTPEVVITANTWWGSVEIYVNRWTGVVVEGVGIMGAFQESRAKVPPDLHPEAPLVRVRGVAVMGSVTVTRKQMPGEKRRRRVGGGRLG